MNQLKTVILLGALTGLLLAVGYLLAGQSGLLIGLLFSLAMNLFSYFFSHKLVLALYRAKPASESEYRELHQAVLELSQKSGIPQPKLYIIPSPHANAFATGRNPQHAVVAVTEGILGLLTKEELKGVLAHEISHVKNRDILISTIAATIAGVISYIAMIARWGAIFGFGGRDRDSNIFELLALAILTPIIAMLIQLAISRSREYLADESGARLMHSGKPLASALLKLEKATSRSPLPFMGATESTAHLFITNPFRGGAWVHLFLTHPPTKKRVERLEGMRF
ncbi:MAG TPA: zinc metalloprotease HtpX [Candidatus Nanoarchaeia archaeon]|nr:zinc metalloprotease HtpX [Candidatus Nanoarchaeia archaeon]